MSDPNGPSGSDTIVANKNFTLFFNFAQSSYNFLACVYPFNGGIKRFCLLRNTSTEVDHVPNWKGLVTQFKLVPVSNLYYLQDTDGDYLSSIAHTPPFTEMTSDTQSAATFQVGGLGSSQITLSQVYQGQNLGNVFSYGYDPTIGGSAVFLVYIGSPISQGNGLLSGITASSNTYTAQFLYYEKLFLLQNVTNGTLVTVDTSDQYMIDGAGNNPSRYFKFRNRKLTPSEGNEANNKLAYLGPALSADLVNSNTFVAITELLTDDNWVAHTNLSGTEYNVQFRDGEQTSFANNSYYVFLTGINANEKYVQLQSAFQISYTHDPTGDFIGSDGGKYYMSKYQNAYKFHMLNPVGNNLYGIVSLDDAIQNGTQFPELQSCYDLGVCTDPRYPNLCPDGGVPQHTIDSSGNVQYTCKDKFSGKSPNNNCCQAKKQPFNCPVPLIVGQEYAFYSPSQQKWVSLGYDANNHFAIVALPNAEASQNNYMFFRVDQPDINTNGIMNGENALKGHPIVVTNGIFTFTLTPNQSAYKSNSNFIFSDGSFSIQNPAMNDLLLYQNLGSDKRILEIPQTINVCNVCSADGASTANTWYTCQDILGSSVCDSNNQCKGVCYGKATCTVDPVTLQPNFKCAQCSGKCPQTWQVCKPGVVSNLCCIADVDSGYCDDTYEETRCKDPTKQCINNQCVAQGGNNGNQKYYQIAVGVAVLLLVFFVVYQVRSIYELRGE